MLNTLGRKIMHDVSMGKFTSWSLLSTFSRFGLLGLWIPLMDPTIHRHFWCKRTGEPCKCPRSGHDAQVQVSTNVLYKCWTSSRL